MTDEISVSIAPKVELTTDIVLGKLTSNALSYKAMIKEELATFTIERYLDNVKAAKDDKAYLNNLKKEVSAKRIEVSNAWNTPLNQFLDEMADLEKEIETASLKLKQIVDEAENKEKSEKKEYIQNYFNSLNFNLVSLDKIFDKKWLNKTFKIKEIEQEIKDIVEKIQSELNTLDSMEDEDKDYLKSFYLETLDLNSTLLKGTTLKQNRALLKKQEEEKKEVKKVEENKTVEVVDVPKEDIKTTNKDLITYRVEFKGTRDNLIKLKLYMEKLGITYTKL